jgi:hypothetical protein
MFLRRGELPSRRRQLQLDGIANLEPLAALRHDSSGGYGCMALDQRRVFDAEQPTRGSFFNP